jgi:hypothetical protein
MMATDQPPLPDPDTCTHREWLSYLKSVDKHALDDDRFQAHEAAVAVYWRRVGREWDARKAWLKRVVEERDRTSAYADEVSERRRELYAQWLDQGEEVLRLRRLHPPDSPVLVEAQQRERELGDELDEVSRQSRAANEAAIEAFRESRK